MAAAKNISPGGALLRSSRMFSLPAPLKPPINNVTTASQNLSFSATTPYPTLQSVTTPSTSRVRGDWGFKRPLPLKSTTKSSTPLIRVKQVDSSEQVTDFASASDHTLTLQKFQEMNIPVLIPRPSRKGYTAQQTELPTKSVFEEEYDATAMDPAEARLLREKRWRFTGPWLAGMAEGEFAKYLKTEVAPRRFEFRQWLKKDIAAERNKTAAANAMEMGMLGEEPAPEVKAEDISDAEVAEEMRKLRDDRSKLFKVVGEFLDLAPIQEKTSTLPELRTGRVIKDEAPGNPYAEQGPPITHPSAGISYLRTNAFIENHPVYGPQANHRHVKARMLSIAGNIMMGPSSGKIGVGGFVTESPGGDWLPINKRNKGPRFDHTLKGGRKIHVEPHSAVVDAKGNVRVTVTQGASMAAFVAKELDGEDVSSPMDEEENLPRWTKSAPFSVRRTAGPQTTGSAQGYGLGGGDFAALGES